MKLKELLAAVEPVRVVDLSNPEITGVACDSRRVRQGYLFVAFKGTRQDGHSFISDAVSRGAAALVIEKPHPAVPQDISRVVVADGRRALARLAATFYGHPTRNLTVVGVTGTNGKTTTTYLVRGIVEAAGGKAGIIGTISYRIGEREIASTNTTPESVDLQQFAAEMRAAGCTHAVMEVSSHALAQGRVSGIEFDAGILTNVTAHEHLDYHATFAAYRRAKVSFFGEFLAQSCKERKAGIVNADDPSCAWFLAALRKAGLPAVTYGTRRDAQVRLEGHELSREGARVRVSAEGRRLEFRLRLRGRCNLVNALAACAYGVWARVPEEAVVRGLESVDTVPGRFEFVQAGQPFDVIVDYAHTHPALAGLLASVREMKPARIIVVFGCGGDRDRGKRPLMGRVAAAMADVVLLTSDNPRSEDPDAIIRDIERGIPFFRRRKYASIPDRREAIREAIFLARPGDAVVIAGKGHETCQLIGRTVVPFDDREEARRAIAELGKSGGGTA